MFNGYFLLLLSGAINTILLWAGAMSISLSLGATLGILSCQRLALKKTARIIGGYVFVVRGIPLYVQLLIAYFVLPDIVGINLSPTTAGIFALGVCSSGYVAEIVRAGMNSIDAGQWEASMALGFSCVQTVRYIIWPQVMARMIPAIANELDAAIKSTALFSTIGVVELTKIAGNIVARYMNPLPVYGGIAIVYLLLSCALRMIMKWWESRMAYAR